MATKLLNSFKIHFVYYGNRKFKQNYVFYIFSSLYIFFKKHFLSTGEIKITVIINYYLIDFRFIF